MGELKENLKWQNAMCLQLIDKGHKFHVTSKGDPVGLKIQLQYVDRA
jgi:hypothetical protein